MYCTNGDNVLRSSAISSYLNHVLCDAPSSVIHARPSRQSGSCSHSLQQPLCSQSLLAIPTHSVDQTSSPSPGLMVSSRSDQMPVSSQCHKKHQLLIQIPFKYSRDVSFGVEVQISFEDCGPTLLVWKRLIGTSRFVFMTPFATPREPA